MQAHRTWTLFKIALPRSQWTALIVLLILLLLLQRALWFGNGGVFHYMSQHHQNAQLQAQIKNLTKRNQDMYRQILAVRHNKQALEALAREELGMIKQGEQFYYITNPKVSTGS